MERAEAAVNQVLAHSIYPWPDAPLHVDPTLGLPPQSTWGQSKEVARNSRNLLAWIRPETLSLILQVFQKAGLFFLLYLLLSVGYSPSGVA